MAYTKVNWQENTPINVENLNNMDAGIKALDDGKLDKTHGSASFGYNSSTGRITHNGNDVKVLSSVNADSATTSTNSTKINNLQVRGGSGLTGASGYITFSW